MRLAAVSEIEAELQRGEAIGAPPRWSWAIPSSRRCWPRSIRRRRVIWARGDAAPAGRGRPWPLSARASPRPPGQRFARGLAQDARRSGHRRRLRAGARHRRRGAPGRAGDRARSAVLGGGVDDIYPPEHRASTPAIAERGCVVSESPPGAAAQARDFPRRNRLISGLSPGGGGGRGRTAIRLADHRPARRRTGARGAGRARLAARSPRQGNQRPDPPGRGSLRGRGGRAAGDRRPFAPSRARARRWTATPSPDADGRRRLRERIAALLSPTPDAARRAGRASPARRPPRSLPP